MHAAGIQRDHPSGERERHRDEDEARVEGGPERDEEEDADHAKRDRHDEEQSRAGARK